MSCPHEANASALQFYIAEDQVSEPLILRARQTGDTIALPSRRGKTLKKLMIEEKIPRRDRERLPVLADANGVIALAEMGPERSRLATKGQMAYQVIFEQRETETRKEVY
jgi:tRNA(Ile)-lysidine synthase